MNNRRDFQQDRFGRGRGDQRAFSRDQHRGGDQHRSGQYGSGSEWDVDSREGAQYGSSQDRFGGSSGSMDYGNPYDSRQQQQGDWSRQNTWDEDRFGYPESNSYGREMSRSQNPGYGPQGRFGEDRYSWGQQYGQQDTGRGRQQHGAYDQHQHPHRQFEPRQSSGWDSSWGRGGSSGGAFTGGRSSYYGGDGTGSFGGWGIPSGSEPGGYGMNSPDRGGQHNWSGSNWGNQDRDGGNSWGGAHSGRFGSDSGQQQRGRTPKGYTRSDDRIKDDVCEQLYRSPDIDVSEVTVEARNGTVTLEGTVPDRRMKHRIEDLCEQCIGVQDVENRIRVQREDRGDGSRFGSSSSSSEDRSTSSSSGSGTSGTADRSNKKSSTGTSSSQH